MDFDQESFNKFIIENNIISFSKIPTTLTSGQKSHWYINWRHIAGDPYLLDKFTDYLIKFTKDLNLAPDCFSGVPHGATITGIVASYKWAKQSDKFGPKTHSIFIKRPAPKNHGALKDKFYVGRIGKTIIFDDAITTGQSILNYIDELLKDNIEIIAVIVATNSVPKAKSSAIKELLRAKGVLYFAMSEASHLLPIAYEKAKLGADVAKLVKEEFQNTYGSNIFVK
jgi:orotate phosphoribosyltransferase